MTFDAKPYDQSEVDNIKRVMASAAEDGKHLCYEVKLDNKIIIHETSNLERFDMIYSFLNENSKKLVISVSSPNSKNKEWYTFLMQGAEAEPSLNGVKDVDKILSEKMTLFTERAAAERTLEKLRATEEQLEQANDYIDILTAKLEELKVKPNHFGGFDIGKLAGSAVSEIVRNYPQALDKIPVLNGLARSLNEISESPAQESQEGGMSFKAKSKETEKPENTEQQSTNGKTEKTEEDENLAIAKRMSDFLSERLTQEQILMVESIMVALAENPENLPDVAELLNIEKGE